MRELTIPASYSVNSAQPDSRQIEITVNLLFEGASASTFFRWRP